MPIGKLKALNVARMKTPGRRRRRRNGAVTSAVLGAPYTWNRPTSTGAGGSDPFWLCWRGKPCLAIRWRGYAASKWSQLERQLILGDLAANPPGERSRAVQGRRPE